MPERLKERLISILRWSERYTRTDMVYLASGGFWSIFAQIFTSSVAFLLAIVIGRYIAKDVYGTYKYVMSFVSMLGIFSLNGLGTAVLQSTARGHVGALQQGFWMNIRWSFLVFLGSLGSATYYFILHNNTLATGILLAGCISPFLASANLAGSFLAGVRDIKRQALYFGIFGSGVPMLSLMVTAFFTSSPITLITVYTATNALSSVYFYLKTLRLYRPDATKIDPGMQRYARHLSLMGILGGIAGNIDQVLLFHYVGAAELAIYNFAIAIPDQSKGLVKAFDAMMQARFANRPDREIHRGMSHKIFILFLLTLTTIIAYVLLAPLIFQIFFPNYTDAVLYSQIYSISMLGYMLMPAASYLAAKRKLKEQYVGNAVVAIFQIATMLVGVIYWGLMGLIVARVITRLFGGYTGYFLFRYDASRNSGARGS